MYDELVKRLRDYEESGLFSISPYEAGEAADAIEELSKPKWIPVTERLPEEPGEYMVYIKDPSYKREDEDFISFDGSYVTSAFYDKDTGLWREAETSFYCANLSCVNTEKTFYITHWMPLPEPPKEE